MRLVLHIGTQRTGSTSLQQWFLRNRLELQRNGIWYSTSLDNHTSTLATYGMSANPQHIPDQLRAKGIENEEDYLQWCSRIETAYRCEVETARKQDAQIFFVSDENCSTLADERMVCKIILLLLSQFAALEAHCFLRPQVEFHLSRLAQQIKEGAAITLESLTPLKGEFLYDYNTLYQLWDRFAETQTHFVPYKKHGDSILYFCEHLGIDAQAFQPVERHHHSLDYRVLNMAYHLKLPLYIEGQLNHNRDFFIDRLPCHEKPSLGRQTASAIQDTFSQINQALCRNVPGIQLKDLTPDYEQYPDVGNFEHVFDSCAFSPFLSEVVVRFNALLWLEKANGMLLNLSQNYDSKFASKCQLMIQHAKQARIEDFNEKIRQIQSKLDTLESGQGSKHTSL